MTKKSRVRLGIHSLAPHFFVNVIRTSHNVTICYRYKLFAYKLARVGNLESGSCQISEQQKKARVETAIDWAQVMTKILVSCAIARLVVLIKASFMFILNPFFKT